MCWDFDDFERFEEGLSGAYDTRTGFYCSLFIGNSTFHSSQVS